MAIDETGTRPRIAVGSLRPRSVAVAVGLLLALVHSVAVEGQGVSGCELAPAEAAACSPRAHLDLDLGRELMLFGLGADLLLTSQVVPPPVRPLPELGFDPAEIGWSLDRAVVRSRDRRAGRASDRTRDAAMVLPIALAFLAGSGGTRWRDLERSAVVYAEAALITGGLTHLGKATFGRARPFAYVPQRAPADGVTAALPGSGTFHSMPSGHSSIAWTAAAMAVTDHLLRRPRATWMERFLVGLAGGALAGSTSALRVTAGVHFPSDVIAGAGLGIASGIVVPLAHRERQPNPPTRAWLQSLGGTLVGTIAGVFLALH